MTPAAEVAYLYTLANRAFNDTRLAPTARIVIAAWLDGHAQQIGESA